MLKILFISFVLFTGSMHFCSMYGQPGCVLKEPVFNIDFGSFRKSDDLKFSSSENYERIFRNCPQDGSYAIASATSDCFGGHWNTVNQDHTPNDLEGRMMLVNAAYDPGFFFIATANGLLPNTKYELAAWVLNVCNAGYNCTPLRPNLLFIVESTAGIAIAKFSTGQLPPGINATWLQYSAFFTTPPATTSLVLKIATKEIGGCGNDFALDDITLRECTVIDNIITEKKKPVIKPADKQPPLITKTIIKEKPSLPKPKKIDKPEMVKVPVKDTPAISKPVLKARLNFAPVPLVILSRDNPVIKRIETVNTELVIDLYDNGEIDGDTVSIYHNNRLIVSHAALSAKPITFRLGVDALHPHHELVMVAENLGSIPPNTSLMIITASNKRYETFISSSREKNAKIVIDLKE